MSLEQLSYLAQIVASIAVVLSLIFVGFQIRQGTAELQRNEHNSTMAQWTIIRMAVVQSREVAELMTTGLQGTTELDAADQFRLDYLINEHVWASFHIWDRTRRGVFPPRNVRVLLRLAARRRAAHTRRQDLVANGPLRGPDPPIHRRRRRHARSGRKASWPGDAPGRLRPSWSRFANGCRPEPSLTSPTGGGETSTKALGGSGFGGSGRERRHAPRRQGGERRHGHPQTRRTAFADS